MTSKFTIANELIGIATACQLIGMSEIDRFITSNVKAYCPFGDVAHSDGGYEKAFRIYPDTNSAYCFACGKAWTPVSLMADARDLTPAEAADVILELSGYVEPTVDSEWDALVNAPVVIDRPELAEGLKVYCSRIASDWEERQFEPTVSRVLTSCLELLPAVKTREDVTKWFNATKRVMTSILGDDRD